MGNMTAIWEIFYKKRRQYGKKRRQYGKKNLSKAHEIVI